MSGPRCGIGLMGAGLVVTLIGLAIVAMETLALPGHWTTVAVGLGLIAVGALWWATPRERDAAVTTRGGDRIPAMVPPEARELEAERARKLALEARRASLEARLHPHFLLNSSAST